MGTINEWTTAIYCVLKEAFGETCTVGDETMQMEPPCLAVLLSQASQKPGPNGRGQRAVVFEVRGRFTSAAQMRNILMRKWISPLRTLKSRRNLRCWKVCSKRKDG